MSKYSNLKFFDSNSDELNLNYDSTTFSWSGIVYIPEVSIGLYETLTIYILEEVKGELGETKYVKPITPSTSGINDTLLVNFEGGYDTSVKSDGVNNDISMYTTTTVVNDANIPELYIKYEESITKTRSPQNPTVTGTSGIFDTVLTAVKHEPIQINIALKSSLETYHKRTLTINEVNSSGTITHNIATIRIYGETVSEDERLEALISNIGMSLSPSDHFVFEDANLRESSPDWKLINRKRRELLLEAANIKPFIGTYKALLNAIKYFGYENITLAEYYLNINEHAENFGKLKAIAVPNQEVKGFLASKSSPSGGELPNSNLKKTSRFSLVYRLNNATGEYDQWDIPEVKEALDFSPDEVLIKLYGLKNRLQKSYIPMHAKIVDIVGAGDYFSQFNINTWNNQQNIYTVNEGTEVGYKLFPERGLFLEDLRKVSPLFTGIGQDFTELTNIYDLDAGAQSWWRMGEGDKLVPELYDPITGAFMHATKITDHIGSNNGTIRDMPFGIDSTFAVNHPAAATILYVEDASTWLNTHNITYDDTIDNNVVGRSTPIGTHPKNVALIITDFTPQLTFATTLNNGAVFLFNDTECTLTSVAGLRPAGEITVEGGVTIRYSGISGLKLTGCTASITSGSVPNGIITILQRGFWEISTLNPGIPASVVKGAVVSNTPFSVDTPPPTTSTKSLAFDNKTNYVSVPNINKNLRPKNALTVSAWVKHDDWKVNSGGGYTGNESTQSIVWAYSLPGGFKLMYQAGHIRATISVKDGTASGYTDYTVSTGPDKFNNTVAPVSADPHYFHADKKDWHMINVTFDGRYIRLYIDGKPADDLGVVPNVGGEAVYDLGSYGYQIYYDTAKPIDLHIGSEPLWNVNTTISSFQHWDGLIDDVSIWNTPLGAARIKELYGKITPSNLPSLTDNPIDDITLFYTNYVDTDLSTFSESNIPVGCPIVLRANSLPDAFDDCEATWDDANEGMEFTYGVVTPAELALIVGMEIGQLAMLNTIGVMVPKIWDGAAWIDFTNDFTWDMWWHRNVYEIEWRLKGPTVNGATYDRSFRGAIENFYEIALTLPYIGKYDMEISFYDLYNVRSVKFEKQSIEVKSKEVETYAITQVFIPKKDWNKYVDYTWDGTGSDWVTANENIEKVEELTSSYYLTLDRANYANSDADWRKSTVVRYNDPVNFSATPVPLTAGFNSSTGPYIWKNLKKHLWNNGETMSWDITTVGADINPAFSFDITDNQKVGLTLTHYIGTAKLDISHYITDVISPAYVAGTFGAVTMTGASMDASTGWPLAGTVTIGSTTLTYSSRTSTVLTVAVDNGVSVSSPLACTNVTSATLLTDEYTSTIAPTANTDLTNWDLIADELNALLGDTIANYTTIATSVTLNNGIVADLPTEIASPSATGDTMLYAKDASNYLTTGANNITYTNAALAVVTATCTQIDNFTIQNFRYLTITGVTVNGAYTTNSGFNITLAGTLTTWPAAGTLIVGGETIVYSAITGQILTVVSCTINTAIIANNTKCTSVTGIAINPTTTTLTGAYTSGAFGTVTMTGSMDTAGWPNAGSVSLTGGGTLRYTSRTATVLTVSYDSNIATTITGVVSTYAIAPTTGDTVIYATNATGWVVATNSISTTDDLSTVTTITPTKITDHSSVDTTGVVTNIVTNGAYTTASGANITLAGDLTNWPTKGTLVVGGETIVYSAITGQVLTVTSCTTNAATIPTATNCTNVTGIGWEIDIPAFSAGTTSSGNAINGLVMGIPAATACVSVIGYYELTISVALPVTSPPGTIETAPLNGQSLGYASGGATLTLAGTLTAWPNTGSLVVGGYTIEYNDIAGQILTVVSDTVGAGPVADNTTITSFKEKEYPQLSKYTFNPIKVDTNNDGIFDTCDKMLAVANGADRMHDFNTIGITTGTGTIIKYNNLIQCNPTYDNIKIINQHEIHNKLNHFTFSYDNSKVPGITKQEWTLKNNSKNIDDIYYNNRWLPFVFDETGDYTLKLKLTDVNGNEIKTTKNILTIK